MFRFNEIIELLLLLMMMMIIMIIIREYFGLMKLSNYYY